MPISSDRPLVGIVGPCTSGKSTLQRGLLEMGITARNIAQEHSFVPDMWQRITNPRHLVFLDVSYQASFLRKQLNWSEAEYLEQHRRLAHARRFAEYYLMTDNLSIDSVKKQVIDFLISIRAIPNNSS